MIMNQTSNPALAKDVFTRYRSGASAEVMTMAGTMNKTLISFLLLLAGAFYTWSRFFQALDAQEGMRLVMPYLIGGGIGGFILALVTIFKKEWSAITVPIYSVLEGLFLGGISAMVEQQFPTESIVLRAVALTFGVFFLMLFLYRSRIIKVTNKFRLGVVAATGGIALVYLLSWIFSFFGLRMGFLFGNSLLSIGISLFVVAIAALNLVLDFDFIDRGTRANVPKFMEWYGAFGLMVTLIWLYLEILRLLSKISSRN